MITKTFDEWSMNGYKIKKGSKGSLFNGKYYFTEEQVIQVSRPYNYGNHWIGCTPKGSFDHWGHEATFEDFY